MTQTLSHGPRTALASPTLDLVAPLSTRTLFWRPRYLQGSGILHHVPFLFWLTDLLRPSGCLGFGIGSGAGYLAICQAVDKLNLEARCYGVETHAGEDDGKDAAAREAVERYNDTNYGDFSRLIKGDAVGLMHRFPDASIDLMLVDTKITETVLSSLRHDWIRKLSDRGVVVLHGLHTRFHTPAAQDFVDTVKRTYPTVTLEAGEGLLVVLYGATRRDQLQQLADLKPGDTGYADVHRVLSHLGQSTVHDWESRSAFDRAARAEAALQDARAALDAAERTADELRGQLRGAPPSSAARGSAEAAPGLVDVVGQLAQMQTRLDAVQAGPGPQQIAELTAAQAALGTRDRTIETLQARVKDQETALQDAAREAETQAKKFEAIVQKKDEVWEKVAERDRTIAALKSETDDKLKTAQDDLGKLREILKSTADERASLAVKTAKLEAMVASHDSRQGQEAKEREALTLKLTKLEAALTGQKAEHAQIAEERDTLRSQVGKLEGALTNKGIEEGRTSEERNILRGKVADLEAEIARLSSAAETQDRQISKLYHEKMELAEARDAAQSEIQSLTDRLEHERIVLTRELEKGANRLKTMLGDLGIRKARVAELELREATRFRELEYLTRAIETNRLRTRDMEEMERRAAAAEQRVAGMMASRSWKITAPARKLLGSGGAEKH